MPEDKKPSADEVVTYLLPDGTVVSNDPRWADENFREKVLSAQENTGVATHPHEAYTGGAQVVGPQSSQEGVGEAATENTIGQQELGMNQRQAEVEMNTPPADQNYDEWEAKELKAEALRRVDEGRDLDLKGVRKRSELIALLKEDDEAQASESDQEQSSDDGQNQE